MSTRCNTLECMCPATKAVKFLHAHSVWQVEYLSNCCSHFVIKVREMFALNRVVWAREGVCAPVRRSLRQVPLKSALVSPGLRSLNSAAQGKPRSRPNHARFLLLSLTTAGKDSKITLSGLFQERPRDVIICIMDCNLSVCVVFRIKFQSVVLFWEKILKWGKNIFF